MGDSAIIFFVYTLSSNDTKASLKVVHKHGPCSKLNQDKTIAAPTPTEILLQDQSRVKSIHSRLSNPKTSGENDVKVIDATTIPAKDGSVVGSGSYIVTVGLGTPQKELSLIFDTGSDITWTQCQPCATICYKQMEQIFDPSQSTSYTNISCSSSICSSLTSATGITPGCASSTCVYGIQYGDSSFSVGFFGAEKLTLTPTEAFNNIYFGCGQNNQGLFGGSAGILGLGINVGGTKLAISASVFSTAGAIIDSGTTITWLPPAAYSELRASFRNLMSNYPLTSALGTLDTCYDFSSYSTISVPKIGFFFSSGIEVDIDVSGVFFASSISQVCLAFAGNSDAADLLIFGNVQQKTLEVFYDGSAGKVGFAPGGCS
ncbi:ASPARTYL PROTEASE FAMILY PROTEIN putative-RELATED [Salix purpurea]|uniref:ASPARTYL PROTEASE FAMILY PROTEIN putative-RELATED n=1 Tax=Salix purpurea TaxID=77065 RepID=A0A9Q0ULJ8_SALPP|nr:ASPARTYL PROTEASE FAMILY PROTEIN putative-RELATED [Salix purpurea]